MSKEPKCYACENGIESVLERAKLDIKRVGRSCVGVFGDGKDMPFIYTVGNSKRGLPELILVGLYDRNDLLNLISDKLPLKPGSVDLGGKFPFHLVEVDRDRLDASCHRMGIANELCGDAYRVMQIVLPDKQGRLPWEPGCEKPYRDAPIYRKPETLQ